MTELRKASYHGYGNRTGKIVFLILGERVFFSGLLNDTTSTVNAAERVVEAICNVAKIEKPDYVFYDIHTHLGYLTRRPGYYEIYQLSWVDGKPSWTLVHSYEMPSDYDTDVEFPLAEVLQAFAPYIGTPEGERVENST